MGKVRKHSGSKAQNGPREVTPEVFQDKYASNRLGFTKPEYKGVTKDNKTRSRKLAKSGLPLKKKKERVYTEKELGIPKLNTALDPVGVKVKGKKGKKFVNDSSMQLILAEVQQQSNEAQASKIERARQVEAIREAKRKEMEEREQQQKEKLEGKKSELKKKPRTKAKSSAESTGKSTEKPQKPGKKRVAFAV